MRKISLRTNGEGQSRQSFFMWRVLALLVLATMLAHWTWVLFAPRGASVLPAAEIMSNFEAEHLFGSTAAPGVPVQASLPGVRLVGVFSGNPGFAVLELDGKRQLGLATGGEIVSGTRLVEVAKDLVVIERGGIRQQIRLESKAAAVNPGHNVPAARAAPPVGAVPDAAAHREL
jgi:hypothetical protein